jgi:hypothetical protein
MNITIPCISLWQPWASLIRPEDGFKHIETRGRQTGHRGLLAIHAAKKWDGENRDYLRSQPFLDCLERAGFGNARQMREAMNAPLPFGAIVAVCRLVDCIPTQRVHCDPALSRRFQRGDGRVYVPANEIRFGDYNYGRSAWLLDSIRVLKTPIPEKGRQWLWNVTLPDLPELEGLNG